VSDTTRAAAKIVGGTFCGTQTIKMRMECLHCLHLFCVYLVLSADVGECRGMSGDVVASMGASAVTSGVVLVRRGHSECSFRFLSSAVDSSRPRGLESATRFA